MSQIEALDYSVDALRALLWQFNQAERLESLIQSKQAWYDENQRDFWDAWFRDVFDLRTANAFGCQVWARILGLSLSVSTGPTPLTNPTFGFGAESGPPNTNQNFQNGNFGQLGSESTSLTVEQSRMLLRLRYFQMISRCTVPEINRFMSIVFGDLGTVYVQDLNDMSFVVYVFDFSPDSDLTFLLDNFDLLPRPAAVGSTYVVLSRLTFGFGHDDGSDNGFENFENGTFVFIPTP